MIGNVRLLTVVRLRLFRITLLHGSCPITAFAFSVYGAVLVELGQSKEAAYFGDVAMGSYLDQSDSKAATISLVYTFVYSHLRPISLLMEAALKAYRAVRRNWHDGAPKLSK